MVFLAVVTVLVRRALRPESAGGVGAVASLHVAEATAILALVWITFQAVNAWRLTSLYRRTFDEHMEVFVVALITAITATVVIMARAILKVQDSAGGATSPLRHQNRPAFHQEVEQVYKNLSKSQVIERLEKAGIANAKLNSMEDFWRHPQLKARGRWKSVGTPSGALEMLKPPFNIEGMEPRLDPVPAVGEHTEAILRELGLQPSLLADAR